MMILFLPVCIIRSFFIQCPAVIVAVTSVGLALDLPLPETLDFKAKIQRVDFGGAITLVLTIFFFLYGLERGGNLSWKDHYTIGALVASVILFRSASFPFFLSLFFLS